MKSVRIALTCVVIAMMASSALAQSKGNAKLSGKIVDEQGQPVADAVVRMQMAGQTEMMTAKSDKKGEWSVKGLAEGQWRVMVGKDGVEMANQVTEIRNSSPAPLTITLAKPAPKVDPTVEINTESQKAATLAQAGKFAEARKIYEDLLVKYPAVYQIEGFIARTYAAENNTTEAMKHLKINQEKEPANVDLKLLEADLLMASGDKAGSKAILDGLDMTQVKDPFPFVNSAITMINDGKADEAVVSLTKLIAQFPTVQELYYYRGRAYVAAQKLPEAKADLDKFVAEAPPGTKEVTDAKRILDQINAKK
ncbi:MAG: carboxypeptidase regulatory-like domain-containing protein [Acidobacteriota bacterium]